MKSDSRAREAAIASYPEQRFLVLEMAQSHWAETTGEGPERVYGKTVRRFRRGVRAPDGATRLYAGASMAARGDDRFDRC